MTPQIAQTLLKRAREGIGLREAIAEAGLSLKPALIYMRAHHREDYRKAKQEGASKALQRFVERQKARGR